MLFYRALLHAYPSSWRAEYGSEMRAVFEQRRHSAAGIFALIALWLEAVADVLTSAAAAHFDILLRDLRQSVRALSRNPGFAVTVVAISAIGIGATTAAFTMVDHVLIRPLPFAHEETIVKLWEEFKSGGYNEAAPANYRDWQRMSTSFSEMAAYRGLSINMTGLGDPQRLDGASVTSGLFPLLGVQPLLGRWFSADDDRESSAQTVMLSYGLWQTEFAGDASVLGRKIDLDGVSYRVIGVMPRDFYFPRRESLLWTAMRWGPDAFEDRQDTYILPVARLKPGVSVEQAKAEMHAIGAQMARAYPKDLADTSIRVLRVRDDVSPQALLMLKVLMAAAICMLLVACTNLANLTMARALRRRRELAVRSALGAGRERLIRQMLTESLLLALLGGALGLFLAHAAMPMAVRLVPVSLPISEVPSLDGRVLLLALGVTCATGIGFGILPALRTGAGNLAALHTGRSGTGMRQERLRSTLVVVEVAGSVVLLVAFGLLARALWRIQAVDPGFRADHVLTLRTVLPIPQYEKLPARAAFYGHVLEETSQLPGVTGAAYVSFLPMVMRGGIWPVEVAGHPEDIAKRRTASLRFITPGYFGVMGIPQLSGRDVSPSDTHEAQWVAVVSQSLVDRYWPHESPLGRHINFGNHDRVIVGVVGDIRVRGLEGSSEPQVYLSWQQPDDVAPWYSPKDLVIRAAGNPTGLAPAIRRIVREADPSLPVSDVQLMDDIVAAETASRRSQVAVLGAFGAMAFLLAAVGIHGLLSFAVSSRTQEIGVRMALGAKATDILGMTLGDGLRLGMLGILAGGLLAFAAGRFLESLLAGVRPHDFATYVAACGLSLAMTLAGSLFPALRAARVDPVTAIRSE